MKKIFALLLFIISLQSHSQVHDYYVFLVKGEALVSNSGGNLVSVKQNSFLDNSQQVTIRKGAEVTLAGKEQEYYVLNSPGVYKLKDLHKEKPDPISGVTKTYLKLVWNELFHPHDDFKTFTNNNNAMAYGGVSRGFECNNLIFPIPDLKTSVDSLHFIWHQTSPSSSYTLMIYDSQGKEIVNVPVKDTQKTISFTKELHSIPGNYYWLVKGDGSGCEDDVPVVFELFSKENEQKLISTILKGNSNADLPGQLLAINKLEKNGSNT